MKIIFCSLGVFFLLSGVLEAQSMLEYSTLTSATTAAALKAKKGSTQGQGQEGSQASSGENTGLVEGAMTKLYGETDQMMSNKTASLLGQVGAPPAVSVRQNSPAPENKSESESVPAPSSSGQSSSNVTLHLNSGKVIKGELVEQKEDHVKVDTEGITTTYFKEEIDRIE
ncbi:MAG: hypothetical protein HZB36_08775 [Candidatus Omnitrophica bacterium]|nr:hypothetical protein [Candidatus Omnitrophota bacterium]